MRYLVLSMLLTFLILDSNSVLAQNKSYFALGIAPTHSFNRNFKPFDIPKIHYEPSVELGFTKKKTTYFAKFMVSYDRLKNIKETSLAETDSWYSLRTKSYNLLNTSGIVGVKRNIYHTSKLNVSIPIGLNITRSSYEESRSIVTYPNRAQNSMYVSKDDNFSKIYSFQLNTGLEANINLVKETVFLHSQINYYLPLFQNQVLWHRVSLNLGLKFQFKQDGITKKGNS